LDLIHITRSDKLDDWHCFTLRIFWFLLCLLVAAAESCAGVVCRDGAECVQGRCKCGETMAGCHDDDDDDASVCATVDGSCDASWSSAGQLPWRTRHSISV